MSRANVYLPVQRYQLILARDWHDFLNYFKKKAGSYQLLQIGQITCSRSSRIGISTLRNLPLYGKAVNLIP